MKDRTNDLGQPIGFAVPDWQACPHPRGAVMEGRLCRLLPIDPVRDAKDLAAAFGEDRDGRNWTYMPYGPLAGETEVRAWIEATCVGDDPCFFSVIDRHSGRAVGVASYLRIDPLMGVIEVGHIHFSPLIQARPIATEAMYLMMREVFARLGYRRYEWKCDALNAPSRAAAHRLGFQFEGIFRQATMYKERNRDTAWFAIIDRDWPQIREAFEAWLDPANFDADGRQLTRLSEKMAAALK
ncbi:MAG: GNAT family protein [Gammaproteobacteria bacterium]|nr:GNAT family protein [Gammaproteobacteria bacterium]